MADLASIRADLKRRLSGGPPINAGRAFGRAAVEGVADNALGLPDLALTTLAQGARALTPREPAPGMVPSPIDVLGMAIRGATGGMIDPIAGAEAYDEMAPQLGQCVLPLPRGDQAVAAAIAADALMKGQDFHPIDRYRAEMARSAELRDAHPIASTLGDVGGDVATVLTGRLPLSARMVEAEKKLMGQAPNVTLTPGVRKLLDEWYTSTASKEFRRGVRRAGETGIEGAVLAAVNEGDPVATAAWSAGTQAAASLPMWAIAGKGPLTTRLGAIALSSLVLHQMSKEATPLGQENIFDVVQSADDAFRGVTLTAGTALAATLAGMGRVRSANVPKLADAMTAVPRAGAVSAIAALNKEDEGAAGDVTRTLMHLANNPDVFNESQQKRLMTAFEKGEDFAETVQGLVKTDPRFVKTIRAEVRNAERELDAQRLALKRRLGLVPADNTLRHMGR